MVDKCRYGRRRRRRPSLDEDEMQADAQSRQTPCPRHRIVRRRRSNHEAGTGQHAIAMRGFDRLVDRRVESEIVSADDE